jgi:Mg/Co/Ni transporter MgtE
LPREPHNAPLHLFSASPELVSYGRGAYQRRSEQTSRLMEQLFEKLRGEGFAVAFTMEDFNRQYIKEHFPRLTPEEQREALARLSPEHRREVLRSLPAEERREVLRSLPAEELLAALSAEQIREHLDRLTAGRPEQPRKARRKK